MRNYVFVLVFLFSTALHAEPYERFQERYVLLSGKTVVIEEPEFEARSIGSFCIRIYEKATPPDETTFFLSGLVNARDGSIEKVLLEDLDDDLNQEIIIVCRSAGTGNYLSTYVFHYKEDQLMLRWSEEGLAADIDILAYLKNILQTQ